MENKPVYILSQEEMLMGFVETEKLRYENETMREVIIASGILGKIKAPERHDFSTCASYETAKARYSHVIYRWVSENRPKKSYSLTP